MTPLTRAEILFIKSLGDKRARDEAGVFVVEGEKLVGEILSSPLSVKRILFNGDGNWGPRGEEISAKEMERISQLKTPTGCLAVVEIPRWELRAGGLVLALDGVRNPGNLGTILRLADWFGVCDVLCSSDSADCFNPKVVQATMGAIARVRVHYGDLEELIPQVGGPVYGTFLDGENIYGAALSADGVIVLGSEGRGISDRVGALVKRKLFIPPFSASDAASSIPTSESLNVAIAAAIVCSEFRRRA